jgi:myo-inositol 2-dehydrogenase/D-chiro-inositol 1-dehydrogenase
MHDRVGDEHRLRVAVGHRRVAVNAVKDGRLVDGPNAWDGYLVALACEAGVKALDGGIVPVEAAERPAFYA